MTNKDLLLHEIDSLSPSCLDEVFDFVGYIKQKQIKNIPGAMLLSETVLARDWNSPEEDAAWKDL